MDCKRCGNCSGGVQCDHVTGTCPNGCDLGMHGDKCDRGNLSFHSTKIYNVFFFSLFVRRFSVLFALISLFGFR